MAHLENIHGIPAFSGINRSTESRYPASDDRDSLFLHISFFVHIQGGCKWAARNPRADRVNQAEAALDCADPLSQITQLRPDPWAARPRASCLATPAPLIYFKLDALRLARPDLGAGSGGDRRLLQRARAQKYAQAAAQGISPPDAFGALWLRCPAAAFTRIVRR
jgi:hypothetical protein